jgi:hypothetical protein
MIDFDLLQHVCRAVHSTTRSLPVPKTGRVKNERRIVFLQIQSSGNPRINTGNFLSCENHFSTAVKKIQLYRTYGEGRLWISLGFFRGWELLAQPHW